MNNEKMVKTWQAKILSICRDKLGRDLTEREMIMIVSRGGFIALESIEDAVKTLDGDELVKYLNQDEQGNSF